MNRDDDWQEQRRIDQQRFSWPVWIVAVICVAALVAWSFAWAA